MTNFTLEELCWLWCVANENYAPAIEDKLLQEIEAASPRKLDEREIQGLASKWLSLSKQFDGTNDYVETA